MKKKDSALTDIHRRVLRGDPTASLAIFEALHYRSVRVLLRQFARQLEADQVGDLVTDAIMGYLDCPARFDPARASLFSYITLIARADALNLVRSLQAEQRRLRLFFQQVVEPAGDVRNIEEDAEKNWDATTVLEKYGTEIVEDDEDEAVLRLILLGERDTAAYASVLNISHLADDEKKAVVKQRRDRLEKRLERLKGKL